MKNTVVTLALSTFDLVLANPEKNAAGMASQMKKAFDNGARIIVFPEMSMTGYTCGDLFLSGSLIENSAEALEELLKKTKNLDILAFIGMPVEVAQRLYNCAVAVLHGEILAVYPKSYIPNYGEYYESRYFESALHCNEKTVELGGRTVPFGSDIILNCRNIKDLCVSAEVCEDMWAPVSPCVTAAVNGATVICNLSASNDFAGKKVSRKSLISAQSEKLKCVYAYVSSGMGESSTDLSFGGDKICGELGSIAFEDKERTDILYCTVDMEMVAFARRETDTFRYQTSPCRTVDFSFDSVPKQKYTNLPENPFFEDGDRDEICTQVFSKQAGGLVTRLRATGIQKMLIGVSGGVDSTLALIVCRHAAKRMGLPFTNVIGITMPCFGTTKKSLSNSLRLMELLGITALEIPITEAVNENLRLIGHDFSPDVTLENAQARQRMQLLFNYANKEGGIVVGTSDLSEIAIGFSTYGGDQMAMYNVNSSVPKTVAKAIISWYGAQKGGELQQLLDSVVNAQISPELIPVDKKGEQKQSTEEIVGSYELIDFILYYHLKYGFSKERITPMLGDVFSQKYDQKDLDNALNQYFSRFYRNQFKRSCMPDGVKATELSLSPRGDYRLPSDISGVF